ncbi:MAG: ABC transporter permease, partial [Mycobacteriales bacterium]
KRRLIGTFFAVFLGVAFLAGTMVLSDTLRAGIDRFFTTAYAGTDAEVRNASYVKTGAIDARGGIDANLNDQVRQVPGVRDSAPVIDGFSQILGRDGKQIATKGPRTASTWVNGDLNPYKLASGHAPRTPDEVVIDLGSYKTGHLRIGDTITVTTPQPARVKLVGVAKFGSQDSFGGTSYTGFTLAGAEQHLKPPRGTVSRIVVDAAPGVSAQTVRQRIAAVLPHNVQVITGKQLTQEASDSVNKGFINIFRTFLLVFAVIALLVGTLSIFNTFSIIAAQRARESALLRAVGATRGQVLSTVVLEALALGVVASVVGLFGGLGFAALLKALFAGFGFKLPAVGLVLKPVTVLVAIPVGILVTVVAGLLPAVRASRVRPLAALRDVAIDRSGRSAVRAAIGVGMTGIGVALALLGVLGTGGMATAGFGALLTLVGFVVLGPVAAGPASRLLGLPLARRVTGAFAQQNAMRNPKRTSGAAAALMIGVGVVTLFTVFAASLGASIKHDVNAQVAGDIVVNEGTGGVAGQFSPQTAAAVARQSGVRAAAGTGTAAVTLAGKDQEIKVGDPAALAGVLRVKTTAGSLAGMSGTQVAVTKDVAKSHGWTTGSPVTIRYPDGASERLTVGAVYDKASLLGDYLLPRAAWSPHAPTDTDTVVYVALKPGVDLAAGKAQVKRAVAPFGKPDVQTRAEYVTASTAQVTALLGIVYVMLALAILIALAGIANTLSLSIHERTRELGLLRAVGATRRQVRAMVRGESVIVALFGTVGGLGLGLFLGWALVRAASSVTGTFAAPVGQLVIVLLVGAVAGVLAGLRPARRAAKLNVLSALATE